MKISKENLIGEVLDQYPALAPIFMAMGMHCLGCPSARSESIEQACYVHGQDVNVLIDKLNEFIAKA